MTSYYTAADDKHVEELFIKSVKESNRIKTKGIEVGHLFYFGDKYSRPLEAYITNSKGQRIAEIEKSHFLLRPLS